MGQITIPEPLKSHFNVDHPTEIVDEEGQPIGLFVPKSAVNSPTHAWSRAELDASYAQPGGRTLNEIWKSLGVR